MKIIFTPQAMEHWQYWKKNNPAVAKRIKKLLSDISEHPFYGMGKPEALKYELSGKWSRRINARHRIIYSVSENLIEVYVLSMRYHYSKKI
jgi:toxin YoeB